MDRKYSQWAAPTDRDLVAAEFAKTFSRELADGLKQAIAQVGPGLFGQHEALVRERTQQVGHLGRVNVAEAAHRFGRFDVEALGEHRKPSQQLPLGRGEQRIGPVHRRPKGLLAFDRGAASACEQPETLIQPVAELSQRQRAQPGRGELDGQRHAVQSSADRHDKRGSLRIEGQVDALRTRPVHKERDRI